MHLCPRDIQRPERDQMCDRAEIIDAQKLQVQVSQGNKSGDGRDVADLGAGKVKVLQVLQATKRSQVVDGGAAQVDGLDAFGNEGGDDRGQGGIIRLFRE